MVIVFFVIVVTLCQAAVSTTGSMDFNLIIVMTLEIIGSIGLGLLLGWLMMLYIERVKVELIIFIVGVAFLTTFGSNQLALFLKSQFGIGFHPHAMLICITAGFFIQNYSPNNHIFIQGRILR